LVARDTLGSRLEEVVSRVANALSDDTSWTWLFEVEVRSALCTFSVAWAITLVAVDGAIGTGSCGVNSVLANLVTNSHTRMGSGNCIRIHRLVVSVASIS
jgi:hypothetical protein